MKYFTRLKVYKANNVVFDPETLRAYSYNWWRFVDKIKGKVVFNNYTYSSSTSKHQSKVRSVLRELNIKVDYWIDAPKGLQDLNDALVYAYRNYFEAKADLLNPKRLKKLDDNKRARVQSYRDDIKAIRRLGGTIDLERIKSIAESVESNRVESYLSKLAKQADLESKSRLLTLNGDGMVNLDKTGLEFSHSGLDQWSVEVSPLEESEFRRVNGISQHYGSELTSWTEGERSIWGRAENNPNFNKYESVGA